MPTDTIAPPAAPAAPAPVAAPKPAAPATPDLSRRDPADIMEHTIRTTLSEREQVSGEKVLPPRDTKTGKFMPKASEGEPAPADDTPTTITPDEPAPESSPAEGEEPGEEGEATEEVPLPEGYVKAAPLPEERVQGFRVRDKDGEVEAPDLLWDVTTAAGPRTLSTDQLVNLARQGNYNHELQSRYQQTLQQAEAVSGELQELERYAAVLEERYIAAMQSDENYLDARMKWEAQNTPQAQLERERAARQQAEEQVQLVQIQAQGSQYFNSMIEPALQTILKALPSVTREEIEQRVLAITDHLRVRTPAGAIFPPSVYQHVEAAILRDVVPWAQQLHGDRSQQGAKPTRETEQAATAKARQEAEHAKIRAQKARRQASVASKPAGSAASAQASNGARPQAPAPRRHQDAEASVIGSTLAAMRGR